MDFTSTIKILIELLSANPRRIIAAQDILNGIYCEGYRDGQDAEKSK